MKLIETLINGLSMGSTYAMIALGYTMVYGIAKMLNFAHGDVIMAGGYMLFVSMSAIGHPLLGLLPQCCSAWFWALPLKRSPISPCGALLPWQC